MHKTLTHHCSTYCSICTAANVAEDAGHRDYVMAGGSVIIMRDGVRRLWVTVTPAGFAECRLADGTTLHPFNDDDLIDLVADWLHGRIN